MKEPPVIDKQDGSIPTAAKGVNLGTYSSSSVPILSAAEHNPGFGLGSHCRYFNTGMPERQADRFNEDGNRPSKIVLRTV
jgi:hypothetical protein